MTEDDVLAFTRSAIKSVWALEFLLLLRRERNQSWWLAELVRELRSSEAAVRAAADDLTRAGFLDVEAGGDLYCYRPASAHLDQIAGYIAEIHAEKPFAVIKAIMSTPNEKLRVFADAFKLKDH